MDQIGEILIVVLDLYSLVQDAGWFAINSGIVTSSSSGTITKAKLTIDSLVKKEKYLQSQITSSTSRKYKQTSAQALVGAITSGICYCSTAAARSSVKRPGLPPPRGRILVISSIQHSALKKVYTKLISCAFASSRNGIRLDIGFFGYKPPSVLEQLSFITGGCFEKINTSQCEERGADVVSSFSNPSAYQRSRPADDFVRHFVNTKMLFSFARPLQKSNCALASHSTPSSLSLHAVCSHPAGTEGCREVVSLGFVCSRCMAVYCRPEEKCFNSFQGVIFTTHKGWFDFFYSAIAADAAQFGRLAVFIAFPPALMCHLISNFCLVYHRAKKGKKSDKQKLAKLGDSVDTYIHRKNPRLLVFPEGHRNRKGRGLQELRTGFLRICFEKKINIFVMPTEGSQHIFNEFTLSTRRNQPLVINYSGVVLPTDYSSWNDFHDAVLAKMKKGYDECCEYYDEITEAKVSKDD
ncbi:TFIIH subunit Tfb4/GTF2H3 like protein [Aduncisulcus paluster]|uniref:TFIIH subunit Tfb4/GTF2H3 like protein n=1 Tax=Aduncisulcus paluster TaxID=2918883 RepID=A0ABQ5KRV1_9EUKA|nr:TFIIH subunit Tfb4/GTF2H3 like protein [Aduncisulcus paluster]